MEWNELSEEDKQKIVEILQKQYPELIPAIINAVQPILDAIVPLLEMFARVGQEIINTIFKDFPPEVIAKILKEAKE